ncbi:MAG: hypothetical protein GY809_00315 [Planctomycetes bacterium]|nr:hypothetical protein [Planctomycetota bacterium]
MMWQSVRNHFNALPRRFQIVLNVSVGLAVGMFLSVARVSNAVSYLSDSPETCMNSHVMTDAYATWKGDSHARVPVCTDCHVPQQNIVAKYAFKGMDGMKPAHSDTSTCVRAWNVVQIFTGQVQEALRLLP